MAAMILPQINGQDTYTEVEVKARIISADTACWKASFFLAMNIGHLLRADNPKLLLDDEALKWQMDIVLTSPRDEPPKYISHIFLAAEDGSVLFVNELIKSLTALANTNIIY